MSQPNQGHVPITIIAPVNCAEARAILLTFATLGGAYRVEGYDVNHHRCTGRNSDFFVPNVCQVVLKYDPTRKAAGDKSKRRPMRLKSSLARLEQRKPDAGTEGRLGELRKMLLTREATPASEVINLGLINDPAAYAGDGQIIRIITDDHLPDKTPFKLEAMPNGLTVRVNGVQLSNQRARSIDVVLAAQERIAQQIAAIAVGRAKWPSKTPAAPTRTDTVQRRRSRTARERGSGCLVTT